VLELAAGNRTPTVLPLVGLGLPFGVAVSEAGVVFVADSTSGQVLEWAPSGRPSVLAVGPLVFPVSVAVDGAGDVFVTDTYSNRVLELPRRGPETTLRFGNLSRPQGIAADDAGDVFVAEPEVDQVLELPVEGARFVFPTEGQVGVDTSHPFVWSAAPGAGGYDVVIGTRPQGSDLFHSGVLPPGQTSVTVPSLPAGRTLYATVLTEIGGRFSTYQGISFSVSAR
jgi:DNA-binding beta-propeller fold protein YncE